MLAYYKVFLFGALIPILVHLFFKPKLNLFFKLLFVGMVLSVSTEAISEITKYYTRNNLHVYSLYAIINIFLITSMWHSVPWYSQKDKKLVLFFAGIILLITLISFLTFGITPSSIYVLITLNVLLCFIPSLHYFYKEMTKETLDRPLWNPYLLTASAYVLWALTITAFLYASAYTPEFRGLFSQVKVLFSTIFYIMIAYVFYFLHKKPELQ